METKIVASITHLKFTADFEAIIVGDICISHYDRTVVQRLIEGDFAMILGSYGIGKIKQQGAIAFTIYKDNVHVTKADDEMQLYVAQEKAKEHLGEFCHVIDTIDTFLWFVKDNSCNISDILCFSDASSIKGLIPVDYRKIVSNCIGEFCLVEYSRTDIEEAIKIRTKFFEVCPNYQSADEQYVAKKDNKGREISEEFVRDMNCIERAFNFIRAARHSKDLAPKFTMYMSMFESLFGKETSEVTHRVCERVAFYLGGDKEEKLEIFNQLKKAYDIRSKYIHGSYSKDEFRAKSYRQRLLKSIDDYARRVLTKVIMQDSNVFTIEHDWAKFVKELIFNK